MGVLADTICFQTPFLAGRVTKQNQTCLFSPTLERWSSNWVGLGGPRCLSEEAELHSGWRATKHPKAEKDLTSY